MRAEDARGCGTETLSWSPTWTGWASRTHGDSRTALHLHERRIAGDGLAGDAPPGQRSAGRRTRWARDRLAHALAQEVLDVDRFGLALGLPLPAAVFELAHQLLLL